ncbi:ABC transporter ATP-binding protein [Lentzea jiangxiensis]|uniref:ABC-2 type transport system ATP-binding protein n=1 Tax=Lentzea jiangxiensis TaxID=641025 RepID=A0A1H0WUW2_9PSEU|nr:ABC transporter ATP-binding protein [Lentzea jiangxiensis]SDP94245.1 ABC-2 type transport system ATP-binding protein [Lentzea jiangxiensis]
MSSADLVVDVHDLRMRYGDTDVLRGVTLRIARGEVLTLLGPNGAGKTTTLEILEGFRKRSAGDVHVLGRDPERADEDWRARIGIVLQSWRDHGKWRVGELLDHLGRYYSPFSSPERPRPYDTGELLELVGLSKVANRTAQRLSGGQRRRLDVALSLVGRPELLFLDEPTVGFDPEARQEFHDVVHRLADLDNTSILLTTHDLDEAEKLSDRTVVLLGGRIVADGSAAQLTTQVAGRAEVRYRCGDQQLVHSTDDVTAYLRDLLRQEPEVEILEVRRASLEDVYLEMVREFDADQTPDLTVVPS